MFASVRLSNSSPDGQRVCWLVSTGDVSENTCYLL